MQRAHRGGRKHARQRQERRGGGRGRRQPEEVVANLKTEDEVFIPVPRCLKSRPILTSAGGLVPAGVISGGGLYMELGPGPPLFLAWDLPHLNTVSW